MNHKLVIAFSDVCKSDVFHSIVTKDLIQKVICFNS